MGPQQSLPIRTVSPGETIFSEGSMGNPVMYVIKEGRVEVSIARGDQKVTLSTLGKGMFLGEMALLSSEPRSATAKALTYCELQVIEAAALENLIGKASPIIRHMLRTLIAMIKKKDEVIAAHSDGQSIIVSYAQLLAMMSPPESKSGNARRDDEIVVALADAVDKCVKVLRQTKPQVMTTLEYMAKLNLVDIEAGRPGYETIRRNDQIVTIDDGKPKYQLLKFKQADLVKRAQQVPEAANKELTTFVHSELELINLADLAALVGVDRELLLRKLAQAEIADEIFAFRKSTALRFMAEKGKSYFSKRVAASAEKIDSLSDIELVDQRSLFEAVNAMDIYDLAKLLKRVSESATRERLFAVMTKAKRDEIEELMTSIERVDPIEAQRLEDNLLAAVRHLMLGGEKPQEAGG